MGPNPRLLYASGLWFNLELVSSSSAYPATIGNKRTLSLESAGEGCLVTAPWLANVGDNMVDGIPIYL